MTDNIKESLKNFDFKIYLIFFIVLIIIFASFVAGKLMSTSATNDLKASTSQEVKSLKNELKIVRNNLESTEYTNKINLQTIEQLRKTIIQLEQQIYLQQKDILSYKAIVSKNKTNINLVFRDLILKASPNPQLFHYKLILTRVDQAKTSIKGRLAIEIMGTLKGNTKILSLADFSTEDNQASDIPFDFKYMAMIPEKDLFASIKLPKDFTPKSIKVIAYLKNTPTYSQVFNWDPTPYPIKEKDTEANSL